MILLLFGNRVLPVLVKLGHYHPLLSHLRLTTQFNCSRCFYRFKTQSPLPVQLKSLWIPPEARGWIEMLADALQF